MILDTDPPARDGLDQPLLVPASPAATEVIAASARSTHPVAVYLARLAPGSRRTMRQALDLVAGLLTEGRADAITLPWSAVRYQHAQAVRSRLAERLPAGTGSGRSAMSARMSGAISPAGVRSQAITPWWQHGAARSCR